MANSFTRFGNKFSNGAWKSAYSKNDVVRIGRGLEEILDARLRRDFICSPLILYRHKRKFGKYCYIRVVISNLAGKGLMAALEFLRRADSGSFEVCGIPLRRTALLKLMRQAQRSGILFKCLNSAEYAFVKLVVKLKDEVRSFILARAVAPIIRKLLDSLQVTRELMIQVLGKVNYWMREAGRALAEKIARIAQSWGYKSARKWAEDEGFIRYLTIINLSELGCKWTV